MATFDLSSIVEQNKKKDFPSIVSICTTDARHLAGNPKLLGGKYFSFGDIESLPQDHSKFNEDDSPYRYFSCISDVFPDADPFTYNNEIVGDQVYFFIPGLYCCSDYMDMARLNSLLHSIKTLLSLMGMDSHIHTSSFRVKQGKTWGMQFHFVFTSIPLTHKQVFGYGAKNDSQDGGGQDAGQDGGDGEGGDGQDANTIPL